MPPNHLAGSMRLSTASEGVSKDCILSDRDREEIIVRFNAKIFFHVVHSSVTNGNSVHEANDILSVSNAFVNRLDWL
jgi:hypothetical protein